MKSLIGHNKPPKDRKVNYKSISIHKLVYQEIFGSKQQKSCCGDTIQRVTEKRKD